MSSTTTAYPPLTYVVVLNWNGWQDTLACLASLRSQDYPSCHILVIDNGSSDRSYQEIAAAFPDIEVRLTGANLGYAGGNNVGLRIALAAGAEYVLLLNNDTVVARDMLSKLIGAMENQPDLAFVGPKTYYASDPTMLWFVGSTVDMRTGHAYHCPANVIDGPLYGGLLYTAYCPGSALLMRASALKELGLLDQRFFVIHEDADWCLRARRRGYSGLVVGSAHLWHSVSASFKRSPSTLSSFYFVRNGLLLSARQGSIGRTRRLIRFVWRFVFLEPLRALRSGKKGSIRSWYGCVSGLVAYAFRIYGPAPGWITWCL